MTCGSHGRNVVAEGIEMIVVGLYGIKDQPSLETESGFANVVHDHNITIVDNGRLVDFIQLERFSGIKHDSRLDQYIEEILRRYFKRNSGKKIILVSTNSFLGDNFVSINAKVRIETSSKIRVEDMMIPASANFSLGRKNKTFDVAGYIITHEMAHIGTHLPFFGKFKTNSLLIHIDGGASDSNSSVWFYDGEHINCLDHSWRQLKSVVNNFNANPLVFYMLGEPKTAHVSVPGKLMGYASFGNPRKELMDWLEDNGCFLKFEGTPQDLLGIINDRFGTRLDHFELKDQLMMDVAASLQRMFEIKVVDFIRQFGERTGAKYLYYSGGAALNIKTNSIIEKESGFDRIFIPPCCNDSGLSLGAAYFYLLNQGTKFELLTPFINKLNSKPTPVKYRFSIERLAGLIANDKVIGISIGASEAGPRALGHRSIIARPDKILLRKRVSEEIKKREWYRPVAPVIADSIAKKILEEDVSDSNLARFMLGSYHIKERYAEHFRGVIHIDGTVRGQVLLKNDLENKMLYKLLMKLDDKYGIKGLLNTSFNVRGKPMVQTSKEAKKEGKRMGLDGVICDDRLFIF